MTSTTTTLTTTTNVIPEDAVRFQSIGDETKKALVTGAKNDIERILAEPLDSPNFHTEVLTRVKKLGSETMRSTADLTNGLLDSPEVDLKGKFRPGQPERIPETITELSLLMDKFDPANVTMRTKILGIFPRGKSIEAYLRGYENVSTTLRRLIDHLVSMKDTLSDNTFALKAQSDLIYRNQLTVNKHLFQLRTMIDELEAIMKKETPERAENIKSLLYSEVTRRYQTMMEYSAMVQFEYTTLNEMMKTNQEVSEKIDNLHDIAIPSLTISAMSLSNLKTIESFDKIIKSTGASASNYMEAVAKINAEVAPTMARDAQATIMNLDKTLSAMRTSADTTRRLRTIASEASEVHKKQAQKLEDKLREIREMSL